MTEKKYNAHEPKDCPNTTCEECDNKYVQLLPAEGWVVWFLEDDDSLFHEPLVAWGLERNGFEVKPLIWADGYVQSAEGENIVAVAPLLEGKPDEVLIDQARTRTAVLHKQRADHLRDTGNMS